MPEEEHRKINTWDNPSSDDRFGREPFVDTIVKTIQSSDEGFNLGISARWGEGKSSILEQLRPKLEALNFKVLTFEPWKYTQDTTSIKRKFLIDIYSQLCKEYDETELYGSTEKSKDLTGDEYQERLMSKLGIFARLAGTTALLFLAILLFFQWISGIDINVTQIFLTNLFIPILAGIYPLIAKITEVTVKQSIPKLESAEQFEKRFNEAIDEIMNAENHPERIIIFVDDLDRCNHTEVEQILTALFTFFNNKHCTYVITADHTVIRRYISHFLQLEDILDPDGKVDMKKTLDMRQKEATEYLKKIFQINFIVPKIPSDLLETMIKNLLDASPIIDPKNPYGREYLVNMILNNFQGNPRKIKHFIRTLTFQLEAISKKLDAIPNGEEKNNLIKVKNSPELLAKTLILQDRFPDFYEQVISEPKMLQRHEEGEMADDKDLQNLLAQEPKFFNSVTRPATLKTIDPYYFLYFSGSTGFIEAKVVDPAEIKALARSADFDGLTKIISGLTDEPRNAQVELIKKEFDVVGIQLPEQINIVRSLFHAISLIEEPTIRLQKLKDVIDAKTKYAAEFASLQSVDFNKFISFADIEIINRLLMETPFNVINIQTQMLEAFINKQQEIGKGEITDRFIQTISEGIKRNDASSTVYLGIAKKLSADNFTSADSLQDALVETYVNATEPLKQEVFDALISFKLSAPAKVKLETILLTIVEKNPIGEAVSMIGNIPTKINKENFDLYKLVSVANKRVETSNHPEMEQLVNILIHPAVNAEIGT
ncbi:MAG TPA: P-loop NTPase fold protein, partial [Candidatus Paceibacterota bacterium]|nr:P-loop NTPase fold protein [Candidatus Paceibacterota bacterium]